MHNTVRRLDAVSERCRAGLLRRGDARLLRVLRRAGVQRRHSPTARLVFAGIVAVALLLLVIGMRMARGPRDPVMALTSIATPAGLAAALWLWGGPEIFHNGFVELIGTPFAIGFALRLFLSLRGGEQRTA